MTALYWVAAGAALVSALQAAGELARQRSPALAAWVLSLLAMSASLALAALVPAVLQGRPGPATWASAGLGIAGVWGLAEVLAMAGGGRRIADMIKLPVAGGGCAVLLLAGLGLVGRHDPQNGGLAVAMAQLTLVVYYLPGLGRIASVARQRALAVPACWGRAAMRAVSVSAIGEIALIVTRSTVLVAGAFGMRAGALVITVTGVMQGVAAAYGIGALAVGPVVTLAWSRCEPWLARWRLHPQWTAGQRRQGAGNGPADRS